MQLNPAFTFLHNRKTRVGYVIAHNGATALVNDDAMDLLLEPGLASVHEPAYQPFFAQAQAAGWVLPAPSDAAATVRIVDSEPHLTRIQVELNLVCNLECAHCYCSSSPRAAAGRETSFFASLLDQAADMGVIHVDFTGGEPLIRKDLEDLIGQSRGRGMVPTIHTNGTLVTEARARALRDAGLAEALVSVDAATPALHDAFRGKAGAFVRTMAGIRAFQTVGVPVGVNVCLNRQNAGEVHDIVRLFRDELQVPFHFDRVIPAGRTTESEDPIALSNADYFALMREVFGQGSALATKKACDAGNRHARAARIDPFCGVGANYAFIKHNGTLALCPTMTEAESTAFAHADLVDQGLREAWEQHPTFVRTRHMQCENVSVCPSGADCGGGCRSNAYLLHGRLDSPDEMYCNLNKNEGDEYVPMLARYEDMRARGELPPRPAPLPRAAPRALTVLA